MIQDRDQRLQAIDPGRSFIVQAPAGSGKTELLTRRFLRLLAVVERPEAILAMTFTRKAAAEMRSRILQSLEAARQEPPDSDHEREGWELARQALARDRALGWGLLENPGRLTIQTMDSFNASLVQRMPWLSRLGGMPRIMERPEVAYGQAASRLLSHIEHGGEGEPELRLLLDRLDNRLDRLRDLLAAMLGRRDQWLACLPRRDEEAARERLEAAIRELTERQLRQLDRQFPASVRDEVRAVAGYAAAHLPRPDERPLGLWQGLDRFPRPVAEDLPGWLGLADLCLTASGGWRKRLTRNEGFPSSGPEARPWKDRAMSLLSELAEIPGFDQALDRLRTTAVQGYTEDQWQILDALLHLLPLAVATLWQVFRRQGEVDFAEMAIRATEALGGEGTPSDLLLRLDQGIAHILVDEFQDTSRLQDRLLRTLTDGWTPGDGRTLFLVGDPMQSIYRFREAEVGLFLQAMEGRLGTVPLEPLVLHSNFRSQQGVVEWCNSAFRQILPPESDPLQGAVPHAASAATREGLPQPVRIFPFSRRDDAAEGQAVTRVVSDLMAAEAGTIGILVRSRSHLRQVARDLALAGMAFQAREIDPLGQRPMVQDLLALTRALLHPADRLHWLAVLRAPWCGLTLEDLHRLLGTDRLRTVPELLQDRQGRSGLTADGRQRLDRVVPILLGAEERRGRVSLRRLVESCWLALGGPACYPAGAWKDAEALLGLLEPLQDGGELPSLSRLGQEVNALFAGPDPQATERLQLMTIHKAKGLEFDHVLLPGLGKTTREGEAPLLRWVFDPELDLLVAPISRWDGTGTKETLYRAVSAIDQQRQTHETGRLLYVACTRARERLYLFGHAPESKEGNPVPPKGSFLEQLWPLVGHAWSSLPTDEVLETPMEAPQPLRRLPLNWTLPELPALALAEHQAVHTASGREEVPEEVVFSGYEAETGRHVGTLVHAFLEQIARDGLADWPRNRIEGLNDHIRFRLLGLGVLPDGLEEAVDRVQTALLRACSSAEGAWVLQPHLDARNEFALGGEVDGRRVHAVVDRTFIDEEGRRCIVDYKTSSAPAGQAETFLAEEAEKYRPQMATYRALFEKLEPQRPVFCYLYFPLMNTLVSV